MLSSGSSGIIVQAPAASYRQPWYEQASSSPWTLPSAIGAARWAQRFSKMCGAPLLSRQTASSSPKRRTPTGCERLRRSE